MSATLSMYLLEPNHSDPKFQLTSQVQAGVTVIVAVNAPVHKTVRGGEPVVEVTSDILKSHYYKGTPST